MLCGGLRRHRALARQAEPRLCIGTAELGRSQLNDLERRLDGNGDLTCRAARRSDLARRTFRAADQAQPQTARRELSSDLFREPQSLVWFIEYMKTAAVEDKLERTAGRRRGEKVPRSEAAAESTSLHLGSGSFDGKRRDIDSEHVEPAFRHPNCVRSGPCTNLKRQGRHDRARGDEINEQGLGMPGVPGQLSRGVTLIPCRVRHPESLAQSAIASDAVRTTSLASGEGDEFGCYAEFRIMPGEDRDRLKLPIPERQSIAGSISTRHSLLCP